MLHNELEQSREVSHAGRRERGDGDIQHLRGGGGMKIKGFRVSSAPLHLRRGLRAEVEVGQGVEHRCGQLSIPLQQSPAPGKPLTT